MHKSSTLMDVETLLEGRKLWLCESEGVEESPCVQSLSPGRKVSPLCGVGGTRLTEAPV